MNKEQVMEKMTEIFRSVFDDDEIMLSDETNADDIEDWDSLEQINLVVNMEKIFKVEFNLEEVNQLQNVGEMANMIVKKLGE